jgi:malate dehydrogenase (oxaloacetate-decarboxylating)(NADP+)
MEIIIELKKKNWVEAEVEIYRYQNFEEDERRNRFAIKYWETRKEEDLFIGCSKVNARKKLFCCNDGE